MMELEPKLLYEEVVNDQRYIFTVSSVDPAALNEAVERVKSRLAAKTNNQNSKLLKKVNLKRFHNKATSENDIAEEKSRSYSNNSNSTGNSFKRYGGKVADDHSEDGFRSCRISRLDRNKSLGKCDVEKVLKRGESKLLAKKNMEQETVQVKNSLLVSETVNGSLNDYINFTSYNNVLSYSGLSSRINTPVQNNRIRSTSTNDKQLSVKNENKKEKVKPEKENVKASPNDVNTRSFIGSKDMGVIIENSENLRYSQTFILNENNDLNIDDSIKVRSSSANKSESKKNETATTENNEIPDYSTRELLSMPKNALIKHILLLKEKLDNLNDPKNVYDLSSSAIRSKRKGSLSRAPNILHQTESSGATRNHRLNSVFTSVLKNNQYNYNVDPGTTILQENDPLVMMYKKKEEKAGTLLKIKQKLKSSKK